MGRTFKSFLVLCLLLTDRLLFFDIPQLSPWPFLASITNFLLLTLCCRSCSRSPVSLMIRRKTLHYNRHKEKTFILSEMNLNEILQSMKTSHSVKVNVHLIEIWEVRKWIDRLKYILYNLIINWWCKTGLFERYLETI